MSVLWQKDAIDVDQTIMRFLAGRDVEYDRELLPFDIQASIAHVDGLGRIGILNEVEVKALRDGLNEISQEFEAGDLQLDDRFEDGHSAIEFWLTEKDPQAGPRVHTGRSRNDQVLVAMRLYLLDRLHRLKEQTSKIALVSLQRAEPTMMMVMPGYTHLQRAVPSSVGLWLCGIAEAFIDNAMLAKMTAEWVSANPLGTAAGYGVNLSLDRDYTTEALGFSRMLINPMYAQNSRGKFELEALGALARSMGDVRRLAWDLSLYTSAEFDFMSLPERWTTGSSIMPNKRNYDTVELLRAAGSRLYGAMAEIESLLSLPSGYHRDLQNTKGPVLEAFAHSLEALALLPSLLGELEFHEEKMRAAVDPALFATDIAVERSAAGVAFRQAYRQVASELEEIEGRDPVESLQARTSPGATAAPLWERLYERLSAVED